MEFSVSESYTSGVVFNKNNLNPIIYCVALDFLALLFSVLLSLFFKLSILAFNTFAYAWKKKQAMYKKIKIKWIDLIFSF